MLAPFPKAVVGPLPPVPRSTLKTTEFELATQTANAVAGMSIMAWHEEVRDVEARGERLKTAPATVSCHDLKSDVAEYLAAPSIKESLRTAARVAVYPVLATARALRSVVSTCTLVVDSESAVHV